MSARLKKKDIEFNWKKLEYPLNEFIGELEIHKGLHYNSVFYSENYPVFGLSGGQLYFDKSFFRFFLESGLNEKMFKKILEIWFEKKFDIPIGYVGWSESLEKSNG